MRQGATRAGAGAGGRHFGRLPSTSSVCSPSVGAERARVRPHMVEGDRQAPPSAAGQLLDELRGFHLLGARQLADVVHGGAGHPGLLHRFQPLGARPAFSASAIIGSSSALLATRCELLANLDRWPIPRGPAPSRSAPTAGRCRARGRSDGRRVEGLVGHDHRAAGAVPLGDGAVGEVAVHLALDPVDGRVEQGRVDEAALAGLVAQPERGQRADGAEHAGRLVVDRGAAEGRRVLRPACHAHHTAIGLQQRIEGGLHAQRALVAEGPDRAVDEPRMTREHRLGPDADLVDHAGRRFWIRMSAVSQSLCSLSTSSASLRSSTTERLLRFCE